MVIACMVVPKIGKGKKFLNGKMCGRNELISDHIEKLTGKYRCRKQVSSHIQVLKNRHKDKPESMDSPFLPSCFCTYKLFSTPTSF